MKVFLLTIKDVIYFCGNSVICVACKMKLVFFLPIFMKPYILKDVLQKKICKSSTSTATYIVLTIKRSKIFDILKKEKKDTRFKVLEYHLFITDK